MNRLVCQTNLATLNDSPYLADRTAARIARMLDGKPAGTPVGSDVNLGAKLRVSRTTVGKAKQKLARLGILAKAGDGMYRTAPGQDPQALVSCRLRERVR